MSDTTDKKKKKKFGSKLLSALTSKKRKKIQKKCGEKKGNRREYLQCQYTNKLINQKQYLRKLKRTQEGDSAGKTYSARGYTSEK